MTSPLTITVEPMASAVVAAILATLPQWFGIPAANAAYVAAGDRLPAFVARRDGDPLGVLLVERRYPTTAEIHLLAVRLGARGGGIGRALVDAVAADAASRGTRLLSVKTLGPSAGDPHYAQTVAFYEAMGFWPVEEFAGVWPGEPCLVLVRPV